MFEYGVILNGSKTSKISGSKSLPFEYGVILNGSKTADIRDKHRSAV